MDSLLLQARARLNIGAAGLGFNIPATITAASYTPVASDSIDSFLVFNSGSPQVVTLETGVFKKGDILRTYREGIGTLEIVAGQGVTIQGNDDGGGQYFVDLFSMKMIVADSDTEFRLVSMGGGAGGAHSIGAHTDVTLTSVAERHVLIYDGVSDFVNRLLTEADISDLHTHPNKAFLDTIDQNLAATDTPTFSNIISTNVATLPNHLVRLDQLNSATLGLIWIFAVDGQVDFTTAEPSSPTTGDRYINTVTGTGSITTGTTFTQHYVYEWDGSVWTEFVPLEGWAVWDKALDENFTFNATEWVAIGGTTNHNFTTGLQGGAPTEYYHLSAAEYSRISDWDTAYSWGDHAGLYAPINHTHGNLDVWRKADGLTSADSYTEQVHHNGNVVLNGAIKDPSYNNAFKSTYIEGNLGVQGVIQTANSTSWLSIRGNQGVRIEQVNPNTGYILIGKTDFGSMATDQTGNSNVRMGRNWVVSASNTIAPSWYNLQLNSSVNYSASGSSSGLGTFTSLYINPTLINVGTHYAIHATSGEVRLEDYPNTRDNGVLTNYLGTDANGNVLSGQISDLVTGGSGTGLERITESSNSGWRLTGWNTINYGIIGNDAVDLSLSSGPSNFFGARGDNSFAAGLDVQVDSLRGAGFGRLNVMNSAASDSLMAGTGVVVNSKNTLAVGGQLVANGDASALFNTSNVTEGAQSLAAGQGNTSWSLGEVSIGLYSTNYTRAGVATAWNSADRIFNIGIGTSDLSRANAFTVLKSGLLTAPSLTPALISAGGDKALITKEYADANYSGGGGATLEGYSETGTRSAGNLISIIGDYDNSDNGAKLTVDVDSQLVYTENASFRTSQLRLLSTTFTANMTFAGTNNRNVLFPDKSGTVAYLSDLANASVTLEGYTETGTRLGGNLISTMGDYDNSGNGSKLILDQSTQSVHASVAAGIFSPYYTFGAPAATTNLTLTTQTRAAAYTQTFQAKSGVLALLSDIDRLEETIEGTAIESTLNGSESIDVSSFSYAYYTLGSTTTITTTGNPGVGKSFVRNMTIKSTGGAALFLPNNWIVIGSYIADGRENHFAVTFNNLSIAGEKIICYISQN